MCRAGPGGPRLEGGDLPPAAVEVALDLAVVQVPVEDALVPAATQHALLVGREGQDADGVGVALQTGDPLALVVAELML